MLFVRLPMAYAPKVTNMMMKKHSVCDIVQKELKALNVGISLDLMTKMATDIRYGHNIVDVDLLLLELLLGYHSYGLDRYQDDGTTDNRSVLYDIVFIIIISIISHNHNMAILLPFDLLIYSTRYYKRIKPYLGIFKSLYISLMWCISIIIMPSVLYDNNLHILQEPLNYVPYILLIISMSNRMDNKDVEDDKKNNVLTIPVKYGTEISKKLSNICFVMFILLFVFHLHNKINF
jgi:hypothetical protein